MEESVIRQRIDRMVRAIRSRDLDGIASLYAGDVVSFDIDPPLRYVGTANKRRAWQAVFDAYVGPIVYEVTELDVAVEEFLGFVHSLNHVSGTLANGHHSDIWVRWTACFRRLDGIWLVVHDHVSVPAELAYGRAVLTLRP
jgi:ketosteroid isomerase-like protein